MQNWSSSKFISINLILDGSQNGQITMILSHGVAQQTKIAIIGVVVISHDYKAKMYGEKRIVDFIHRHQSDEQLDVRWLETRYTHGWRIVLRQVEWLDYYYRPAKAKASKSLHREPSDAFPDTRKLQRTRQHSPL